MEEEVSIDTPHTSRCVGLINDDESDVGRVHLGVVHLFDVQQPAVRPRESEIIECGFRPVPEILADMEGFESWSQICMKALHSHNGLLCLEPIRKPRGGGVPPHYSSGETPLLRASRWFSDRLLVVVARNSGTPIRLVRMVESRLNG